MKKVITINLNGTAYQVEEVGFDKLKAYLEQAAAALSSNPDKNEILADLEQAIAEKSRSYLTAAKNVIATDEIDRIIASMGPVEGAPAGDAAGASSSAEQKTEQASSPKKLYLLKEGAILMGVCNGLAAYFNIDVTVVRILFVILTIFSSGGFIVAYVILAIIVPSANTPEEKTAAHGMAYTAQQLINRAKTKYETFAAGKKWDKSDWMKKHSEHHKAKHEMREKRRQEKRAYRYEMRRAAYARNPLWDTLNALIWLAVLCFVGWFAYTHFAEIQAFIDKAVLYFDSL